MSQNQKYLCDKTQHHDLSHRWTFFYCIPNRSGQKNVEWQKFLHPLHSFKSAEDFWAIYNTVEPPKRLPKGCRYYVFRYKNDKDDKSIFPLWEDEANKEGYQLEVEFNEQNQNDKQSISDKALLEAQEFWLHLTLSILGNSWDHSEKINGTEFNNRGTRVRVSIWTSKIEEPVRDIIIAHMKTLTGKNVDCKKIGDEPPHDNKQ